MCSKVKNGLLKARGFAFEAGMVIFGNYTEAGNDGL